MDQSYFDHAVAFRRETIDLFEKKLAKSTAPAANRARLGYTLFREHYELLIARYSRGEAVADIKASFPAVVDSWERYLGMEGHQTPVTLNQDISDYVRALWLVSLAIIFGIDDSLFVRLIRCIGSEGEDSLLERLIATRIPGRPEAHRLIWPKPFKGLYDVIDAPVERKTALFREFLKSWYPALGKLDAYWHDNHKGPEGGGFFGYWCIEAAGVVSAFGLDDSQFRDAPYYPKDLVLANR